MAPFLFCLFWISRIFELFLKISRPIVTILCAIGSVGITIGAIIHIFFYLQGRGISVWGIVLSVFFAAALMVVPAAGERRIHYFKGVKDKEELEKRLSGLLRIYRPEKEFAEDALTRSILDEFEYLKGRLPDKAKDV